MGFYKNSGKRGVKIPKASEIIARRIRNDIVTHVLKEGQLLPPEVKLMEEFGVSRPTIREAYRILESDRLVSVTRGAKGGAVIHSPDPDLIVEQMLMVLGWEGSKISDLYEARAITEPELVKVLTLKGSKEAPDVLREILERIRLLIKNTEDYAEVLTEFHMQLVSLAGNHIMRHMAEVMNRVMAYHKTLVLNRIKREDGESTFYAQAEMGLKSYKKLIDLIEKGEADAAENHWRKHIKNANEIWLNQFDMSIEELYLELQ